MEWWWRRTRRRTGRCSTCDTRLPVRRSGNARTLEALEEEEEEEDDELPPTNFGNLSFLSRLCIAKNSASGSNCSSCLRFFTSCCRTASMCWPLTAETGLTLPFDSSNILLSSLSTKSSAGTENCSISAAQDATKSSPSYFKLFDSSAL